MPNHLEIQQAYNCKYEKSQVKKFSLEKLTSVPTVDDH